jgi:type IV pilus assembly protein PilA
MVASRRQTGFTLIEAMIVVVIIGIMAALAVVGYRKWVQTSHLAEAQDMVSHIRSAEEAFRAENGITYLPVSRGLGPGYDYPAPTPGAFKTGWGGPCASTQCYASNVWQQLAVQPNGPVLFGYSVVTNLVTDPTGTAAPPSIIVNGVTMNLSAMQNQPWYVIEADGDYFGTGSFTSVFGFTGNNELFISNGTQ